MLISELAKSLKRHSGSIQSHLKKPETSITGLQYFTDQKALNSYTLYVIFDSELSKQLLEPEHTYNFLILSSAAKIPTLSKINLNILWELKSDKFSSIMEKTSAILADNYHMAETLFQATQKHFNHEGLSAILESAYEYFKKPIVLVDCNNKLIGHAPANEPYIEMLTSAENSPKAVFDKMLNSIQNQISHYSQPSYLKHPFNEYNILIQNIYVNNFLIGSLFLVEEYPFSSNDFFAFSALVKMVTSEMSNNFLYTQTNGHFFSVSLHDILTDKKRPAYLIRQQLHSLGLTDLSAMRFIMFEFKSIPSYQTFSSLLKDLDIGFPEDIYTLSDNQIILFLSSSHRTKERVYLPVLLKLEEKYHLYIGISNLLYDVTDLHTGYHQAQTALEHHKNEESDSNKSYIYFEDIAFSEVLKYLSSNIAIKDYCSVGIISLLKYDQENATQLSQTLYIYFLCYGDAVLAAKRLNIHKNTLYYRLNIIREVLDNDLTDGKTNQFYFFSLQALQITDMFTPPDC